MRWMTLLAMVACANGDPPAAPDATEPEPDDGWDQHAFTSGTLQGCSTDIAWQRWARDEPAEATIVFAHGRSEYTDTYHHVLRMLEDRPWDFVLWDQYGHGNSGGTRSHAEDLDAQHVCDMSAVIDELVDPELPLGLVSHSTGGLVNARWLQQNPGRASAVVMGSPLLELVTPGFTESAICSQARLFTDSGMAEESSDPDWEGRPPCDPVEGGDDLTHDCALYEELLLDDPLANIGPPTWGWIVAVCDALVLVREDVSLVTEPLHVMQGALDIVVGLEGMDDWCADADATGSCAVTVYENDLHQLYMELDREEVVATAADFLAEHL